MQSFCFDSIDSTNDAAKRLLADGRIVEPAFLVAREQTAGRGSRGRSWHSPRDAGIYLTVVDFPEGGHLTGGVIPAHHLELFTLAAGAACLEAIEETVGVSVELKPVNDLYFQGRKLGGILTESIIQGGVVRALMTGIGINIHGAVIRSCGGSFVAVGLDDTAPRSFNVGTDVNILVAALTHRIRQWNRKVGEEGATAVIDRWTRHSSSGFVEPALSTVCRGTR